MVSVPNSGAGQYPEPQRLRRPQFEKLPQFKNGYKLSENEQNESTNEPKVVQNQCSESLVIFGKYDSWLAKLKKK
jgi:hypothetical protein